MRRLKKFGAAAMAALAVGSAVAITQPAAADTTPTADSQALQPTPLPPVTGATVGCTAGLCNLVGPLLGPLLAGLVNPLLDTVQAVPNNLLTPLTNSLTAAGGLQASAPPGGNYSAAGIAASANPLLGLGLGAISGTATTSGAQASVALAGVNVLGISLLGGGVVSSESDCPTTGPAPSAHSAVANLSLLGGALTVSAADGSNALSVTGLSTNLIPDPLGGAGLAVHPQLNGNLLTVTVGLTLADLLHGLGLSLPTAGTDATVTLTLTVDTGRTADSSSAAAWGLRVRVGLAVHLALDVAGLATLSVDVGNSPLLELKLASTNCTSGAGSGGGPGHSLIPPALT